MADNSYSEKSVVESFSSKKDDLVKSNKEFMDKEIDSAFKQLQGSLHTTLNSSLSAFQSDYEKKIDINRENHAKAIENLKAERARQKQLFENHSEVHYQHKDKLKRAADRLFIQGQKHRIFSLLERNKIEERHERLGSNLVENYFLMKRVRKILANWHNVAHSIAKSRIRAKYSHLFNEKYEEQKKKYSFEIEHLTEVLRQLEGDIAREMEERRRLNAIYDQAMSTGAVQFVSETGAFKDFNTSDIQTPRERVYRQEAKPLKEV